MVNWRVCRPVCMWGQDVSGNKENQVMLYNAKEQQVKVRPH